jgi:hypothetical protein
VADLGVSEEVLLVRGDHGLLPALAGERPDGLEVLPDRDVDVLRRGRVTGPSPCSGELAHSLRPSADPVALSMVSLGEWLPVRLDVNPRVLRPIDLPAAVGTHRVDLEVLVAVGREGDPAAAG